MSSKALGLIETIGLAAAIEAADAATKSANVTLLGYENSKGGGMITVKVVGDVGAVKAAVAAGTVAAQKIGRIASTSIIPRPHNDIEPLINRVTRGKALQLPKPKVEVEPKAEPVAVEPVVAEAEPVAPEPTPEPEPPAPEAAPAESLPETPEEETQPKAAPKPVRRPPKLPKSEPAQPEQDADTDTPVEPAE